MRGAGLGSRIWGSKPCNLIDSSNPRNANYSELRVCSWSNRLFQFSTASEAHENSVEAPVAASSPAESASPEVVRIHHELVKTMEGRCIPQSRLVSSLLQQCSCHADVKLAMDAIARLRTTRAVQGQQQANFSCNLTQQVLAACLRVKDPENALKTIWAHNIYGFTPCIEAAHQILAYARDHKDLELMQKALKTMVSNSLPPTRTTADIVLRLCKEQGNETLLFSLSKEFHRNGMRLRPAVYDICISSAANAGDVKHVNEIQQWRSRSKLPFTTASTFALSKAHLLKREPKDAAQLIHAHVPESEERDMYLRVLVRAWPVEVLSRRKRSANEENLRADIETMLQELRELGCHIAIDASQEFATGKETLRRVVYA